MSINPNIQAAIDFLISKSQKEEALTPYEYSELLQFSSDDLNTIINNLFEDEDEYNFFDLEVSYYPNNYEQFISMEDDSNIDYQYQDFPILSFALRNRDLGFARNLLENLNAPQHSQTDRKDIVTTEDCLGQTPLHIAVWLNQYHITNRLIQSGADVNALNSNGNSPLIESDNRNEEGARVVALLEEYGGQYIIDPPTLNTSYGERNITSSNKNHQEIENVIPKLTIVGEQFRVSFEEVE